MDYPTSLLNAVVFSGDISDLELLASMLQELHSSSHEAQPRFALARVLMGATLRRKSYQRCLADIEEIERLHDGFGQDPGSAKLGTHRHLNEYVRGAGFSPRSTQDSDLTTPLPPRANQVLSNKFRRRR